MYLCFSFSVGFTNTEPDRGNNMKELQAANDLIKAYEKTFRKPVPAEIRKRTTVKLLDLRWRNGRLRPTVGCRYRRKKRAGQLRRMQRTLFPTGTFRQLLESLFPDRIARKKRFERPALLSVGETCRLPEGGRKALTVKIRGYLPASDRLFFRKDRRKS